MDLSNTQKRIFSLFTIMSFSMGSMAPEILHAAANEHQARQVSTILNGAKQLSSSAETYTDFVFKNVAESDKKFIASILPDLSEMPNVRSKGNSIFVQNGDEEIEIQLKNVATGKIAINGKDFVWNGDQSFRLNFQRVNNLFIEKKEVSLLESLVNFVLPTAYADDEVEAEAESSSDKNSLNGNTLAIVIGAVVAVVAVGIMLYLNAKNKRKSEERKMAMTNDYNLQMHAQETERQIALADTDSAASEDSGAESDSGSHSSGNELLI